MMIASKQLERAKNKMHKHPLVDSFYRELKKRGKSPATTASYCRDAQSFLNFLEKSRCDISQVEANSMEYFHEHLIEQCQDKENSIRRKTIGVRQFFRCLVDLKKIESSPFDQMPIPKRNDELKELLQAEDIDALIEVCRDNSFPIKAYRNSALVSLLAYEGLKVAELVECKWTDHLQEKDYSTLGIRGSRQRYITLSPESSQELELYEKTYKAFEHESFDPQKFQNLLIAFRGRESRKPSPKMSRHGLKFLLYELGDKAGITKLNTEKLRQHAIQYQLSIGKNPEEIMNHLGLRQVGNIIGTLVKKQQTPCNKEAKPDPTLSNEGS